MANTAQVSVPLAINATTTAKVGPGATATTCVITGARTLKLDMLAQIMSVQNAQGLWSDYDYNTMNTITVAISGNTTTVTAST